MIRNSVFEQATEEIRHSAKENNLEEILAKESIVQEENKSENSSSLIMLLKNRPHQELRRIAFNEDSNRRRGLLVALSVANLLKRNKSLKHIEYGESIDSEKYNKILIAEIALLEFFSTCGIDGITVDAFENIPKRYQNTCIHDFLDPENENGIYLNDDIVEYAFEIVKAKDPFKEFHIHCNFRKYKATIEYLSMDEAGEFYKQSRLNNAWLPESVIELWASCSNVDQFLCDRICKGKEVALCVARAIKGCYDTAFKIKKSSLGNNEEDIGAILALLDYFDWHIYTE